MPFVFSSNGHLFVEFDRFTGLTSAPRPLAEFPTPTTFAPATSRAWASAWTRRRRAAARALHGRRGTRRYYQDAAIRAVLEKLARGEKRALLSLATGAGKTFIAVNLLKRIADAGHAAARALRLRPRRAAQAGAGAFQNSSAPTPRRWRRASRRRTRASSIATYQTLDVPPTRPTPTSCGELPGELLQPHRHRRVPPLGLGQVVAGPRPQPRRRPDRPDRDAAPDRSSRERDAARRRPTPSITADNFRHFGEPVYEYDMGQGIEDGYLAACEIVRRDIFLDEQAESERETVSTSRISGASC